MSEKGRDPESRKDQKWLCLEIDGHGNWKV